MNDIHGHVVTKQGIIDGRLTFDQRINAIEPYQIDDQALWILPGFIDLHVHGGGGADCMDGADAVRQMASFHAKSGTTTLLATTMTDTVGRIDQAFDGIADAMANPKAEMASVAGVHLEGPFINPDALGAQPPHTLPPDPVLAKRWHDKAAIRVATIAPEIDEAGLLFNQLQSLGTKVQIGHTTASYAQSAAALDLGYAGFTHLYNAMSGLHHRRPGTVGCALAHATHAELILDYLHVSKAAVKAAIRAIPNLYAITDAGPAAGMPDGRYKLGAQDVIKTAERVIMPNSDTIAGSALTMIQAFKNLLALGLDVTDASRRCSTIQAGYLDLQDRGSIEIGKRADLVVLNANFDIVDVRIAGKSAMLI